MSVESPNSRTETTANGTTTVFAFPHAFLEKVDIKVYKGSVLQISGTHYTFAVVTDPPFPAGSDVVFIIAPANGEKVVIFNDPPITQVASPTQGGPLPVKVAIERPLDKLTMIAQRLSDILSRTFHLADYATGVNLAEVAPVANRALVFDANGILTTSAFDLVPSIAAIEALLALSDADVVAANAASAAAAASASAASDSAATASLFGNKPRGRYIATRYLFTGPGQVLQFHTTIETRTLLVKATGGGGGGGGAKNAGGVAAGGGGGGGGYGEKLFAVNPDTDYAYFIGNGGAAGSSAGGDGADGQDSTFTVGATTITAKGGKGGKGSTTSIAVLGGDGGAAGTGGDFNGAGAPGDFGCGTSGSSLTSGRGGQTQWGGGGNSRRTAGVGNGAESKTGSGGAGGVSDSDAGFAGGSGAIGANIIVEEYT
jgi:hypothetical protein